MFKMLILCGGPSFERDISLNSARSVYDNIHSANIDIKIIFIDKSRRKHVVSPEFLYSNTVSDFDFKLETEGQLLQESDFISELKLSNLVFPVLHGEYGEDGEIQALCESLGVAYVGSPSGACKKMYNKELADYQILKANGFFTIPKLYIRKGDSNAAIKIARFFNQFHLKEVVLKPTKGGSSIGVLYAGSVESATNSVQHHLEHFGELVVEPICKGKEFTVIILQNSQGKPVALMPTEIEIVHKSGNDKMFNKRRKYLATTETHYYCPARFSDSINENIREQAQELFTIAGARDFLRIDGWLLDSGDVYFSDFNPISGMEQNSFIFQQASKCGLTHRDLLEYITHSAANRQWHKFPNEIERKTNKKLVNILMGGWTSERQVSLMSGTNVWLKLMQSDEYEPVPHLLFLDDGKEKVIKLPYSAALNHTVEEILYQFEHQTASEEQINGVREQLGLEKTRLEEPSPISLDEFINKSNAENAFVFLALHGGFGENGTIQAKLQNANLRFNGSHSTASQLCMNKFATGEKVTELALENVRTARKKIVDVNVGAKFEEVSIAKPNDDGCSTGVVIINDQNDLDTYIKLSKLAPLMILPNTFENQPDPISLSKKEEFLLEEFIKVDDIKIVDKKISFKKKSGWLELTVGVLESEHNYHSLNPSITIAENAVLSLEEKFQGGTGINITPPPADIFSQNLISDIKNAVQEVARICGVQNYCRIDLFANVETNEIIIIEINTLPGLSPSTVLFQQGVKEAAAKTPRELLETIIKSAIEEKQ